MQIVVDALRRRSPRFGVVDWTERPHSSYKRSTQPRIEICCTKRGPTASHCLEEPKSGFEKHLVVNVVYNGTDVSLIKRASVNTGFPLGTGCALACMLLTS